MRILGVLFLVSTVTAFGAGIGPDITTLGSCDDVSVLSDLTGSEGCAIEPFSFFNASFTTPAGTPVTSADGINVSIGFNGSNLGISFSGFFLYPSDTFTEGEVAEYVIRYMIDPPPPVILGFDMDMSFDGGSFRFAGPEPFGLLAVPPLIEVITDLCFGSTFGSECAGGVSSSLLLNEEQLRDGVRNRVGTSLVDVVHYIRITQSFNIDLNARAPLAEQVPEPGTWVLFGSGIVLIAIGRRRR